MTVSAGTVPEPALAGGDQDLTSILVDGREFVAGLRTGIGRFLEGVLLAVNRAHADWRIVVALDKSCTLPASLQGKVEELQIPLGVELFWPGLARGYNLFISPYPKLPWMRLPCPSIHTVHDVLYMTCPAYRGLGLCNRLAKTRLRRALKMASMTWFVSEASHRACEALMGKAVPHHVIHHNAIDASFTPGEGTTMRSDDFFLYVGNGLPHKNLDVLMRAWSGVDAVLVCAGVRDEHITFFRSAYPKLENRVCFRRQVEDAGLLRLYRTATALLLPSTDEGFGYPPLEAMACGTPAIVSDIPALRETTHGNAVYCSVNDELAWRIAAISMLDQRTRQAWSRKGMDWACHLRAPAGWQPHIRDIENLVQTE